MYVELHARSAFSFLEATALPEDLAEQAARLEQPAIALVDSDGVYGAARFYRACTASASPRSSAPRSRWRRVAGSRSSSRTGKATAIYAGS